MKFDVPMNFDKAFNFQISPAGKISTCFLARDISDFLNAVHFVKGLPYKRNHDKSDLSTVFTDRCGTCSTKNALIKQLAVENNQPDVKLILSIFKMNGLNTAAIKSVLQQHDLDYIPEAHNFLFVNNQYVDCTSLKASQGSLQRT